MTTRPYAFNRRTARIFDKLLEINWGLVLLITVIACVGFAMLYSVAGGQFQPWAQQQIVYFIAGLVVLIAAACVDIRVWMALAYPMYAIAFLLLVAVELVGHKGLGAQRWLDIGPLQFQPSELMKIALILTLSRYLSALGPAEVSHPRHLLVALAMIALPVALVLLEPNLGTAILLAMGGFVLLFVAGLSWYWIVPAAVGVMIAVPTAWEFFLHEYQKQRVLTFLDPESDMQGAGWNITQAKIALGSGGISGKGFLNGTQSRLNFLPEKATDFIATNIGEEFGFLGSVAMLMLFAVVLAYGVRIALSSRNHFGRLLAMGITINFFLYIMINGAMVMGLIPVVGIPMPLISYGGSAMLTVMFGFGLLMSVHVHRQVEIPRHAIGVV